jgi:hypothetical protein
VADLGSFGTPREAAEPDTFGWFEHTLRSNPDFTELEVADFLESAAKVDEANISEAMALLKGTFRMVVHPDDFDTFWSTAKRERQGVDDLMGVLYAVVEAVTDRPTERPSDSSDGPTRTAPTSAGDSSSRVVRRLETEGRPSMALMVMQASEAQGSRASA